MTANQNLLQVRNLSIDSPTGRPLIRNLSLNLSHGDHVALVGRNGVGKSTLLNALAGLTIRSTTPSKGSVTCYGQRVFVPQQLRDGIAPDSGKTGSPGELRARHLRNARASRADLLILDEPTHDLDSEAINWLIGWLKSCHSAVVVASHDRRVLQSFHEFFVVSESGCRHVSGDFDTILASLSKEYEVLEDRFVSNLAHLVQREKRSEADRRRRQRKKHLGRIREVGRSPSRVKLNDKRSYAQEKQGKRAVRREARIEAAREWTRATRRSLAVTLPLEAALPNIPDSHGPPIIVLDSVTAASGERTLFADLSLSVRRERLAISGPNGSGKTTLVELLTGDRTADCGSATRDSSRIGYVAQNSLNWCLRENVLDHLIHSTEAKTYEHAARILRAHHFPIALATRPLRSLSPGERVRAALICLSQRHPPPELLILDEPTDHLDILAVASLEAVLRAWTGGLVVVSHDSTFISNIGVDRHLELGLNPS